MPAQFHFAEDAFALHLLLQSLQSLVDVVVANENLQAVSPDLRRRPAFKGKAPGAAAPSFAPAQ
jgi:hypothetical protein